MGRSVGHLAPNRADYEQAFKGVNLSTEKISGSLFEISGTLAKTLATLKVSGTLFEASKNAQELFFQVCGSHSLSREATILLKVLVEMSTKEVYINSEIK